MMNLKKLTVAVMAVGLSSAAVAGNVKGQAPAADHSAAVAAMNTNVDSANGHVGGSADWYRRIRLSGMVNVDATYSSKDNIQSIVAANADSDQSQTQLAVNNATLFVDSAMSNWSSAHIGFSYEGRHDAQFAPVLQNDSASNNWRVDEAFVTLANFNKMPVYARAGQQYVNFGDYQIHPMLDSFTQLIEETNGPAVTFGFVAPVGIYGSLFAEDGKTSVDGRVRADNYGARVGFGQHMSNMAYDLHVDYMRNLGDATYVNARMNDGAGASSMTHRVGGVAAHAAFSTGPFDVAANYVTATRNFDPSELGYNPNNTYGATTDDAGAEPWAVGVNLGYKFRFAGHRSHLVLGVERSGESSYNRSKTTNYNGDDGLALPQSRYSAQYTVNMFRHTDLGVVIASDHDYSAANGGTGESGTTGVARLSFQFA